MSPALYLQCWEEAGLYKGRLEIAQLGRNISRHPEIRILGGRLSCSQKFSVSSTKNWQMVAAQYSKLLITLTVPQWATGLYTNDSTV